MQKTKSPIPFRIVSTVLLIVWMGLIFYLSHQNSDESSALSGGLIETVIKFFLPNAAPNVIEGYINAFTFIVRKSAHFSMYAVLGVFGFMTLVTYKSVYFWLRLVLSWIVCIAYSVSDEYHQTFISGRSGELRDVLIDSAGALTGILFSALIYGIYIRIKNKREPKMKKKQYMELAENLQQRLHKELITNKNLSEENSFLNQELHHLRERIVALENALLPCESAEEAEPTEEIFAELKTQEEKPSSVKTALDEPVLSDPIKEGAEVIGKIVLSSAQYCNALTGASASRNAKELVNLILGRTEVAKAEILRLSSLQIDPQERYSAMKKEMTDAEDYFKSVMAQKN